MFRTQYLDYAELTAQLSAWATSYPGYVSISSLGQSAEGRDILAERWAEDAVLVQSLREWLWANGLLKSTLMT